MAGLPPKPGDPLPPRLSRVGTSPRAASMRDDLPRDREDRRRRSPPWQDGWRRLPRNEDRYQDQPLRKQRDWEDRDRDHPRSRIPRMDSYRPDSRSPPRRRSPNRRRISSRSPSRDAGLRSPRRRSQRSPSPYRRSRSRSPRRRRSSPYSHRQSSRERRRWSDHSPPPRRRSPDHPRVDKRVVDKPPRSRSRALSEARDDDDVVTRKQRRKRSRSKSAASPLAGDPAQVKQEVEATDIGEKSAKENVQFPVKKLPAHPTPSGPRRPRTPTGPRARTPGLTGSYEDGQAPREDKGKGKEKIRDDGPDVRKHKDDRSASPASPARGSHKRKRRSSTSSRSYSRSNSRSRSHSPSRSRSRSRSRYHSPRSSSRSMRSRSPRSRSRSPSLSRSHRTRSDRVSPRAPTGPRADRDRGQNGRQVLSLDDLIRAAKPRISPTQDIDTQIKAIQEQRAKLEKDHVNIMRGVRRAQHELELAMMEQKSAEERRKAAERVHERIVKGFLAPII